VAGLHLQFGADAASEVVVSWHNLARVRRPRVLWGTPEGGFGRVSEAKTVTYRDAQSGAVVRVRRHGSDSQVVIRAAAAVRPCRA